MPFFCWRAVAINSATSHADPSKRNTPLQSCTLRKLITGVPLLEIDVLSRAPAMGAPINDAMEQMPHDMPIRVPRRDRSGQMFGKQEPGRVTRPAEKKPAIVSQLLCSTQWCGRPAYPREHWTQWRTFHFRCWSSIRIRFQKPKSKRSKSTCYQHNAQRNHRIVGQRTTLLWK